MNLQLTRALQFLCFVKDDQHDMEVDNASSATQATPVKHSAELEIYCYLLVLIFLIDQKKYSEVSIVFHFWYFTV